MTDLAARARQLARAAERGSAGRRAYGAVAVALATTSTTAHARRVLADWDGPAEVKAAALAALRQLAEEAACGPA